MLVSKLRLLLVLALLAVLVPGGARAFAASGPSTASLRASGAAEVQDVFVHLPNGATPDQITEPVQVVVALHGMGGNGADFGNSLVSQADVHGWLLVAPTINYGDWTNPEQIAHEEPSLIAWLSVYIANLSNTIGVPVQPRVLLFGHSRGAQLALRFTEIHPAQVDGVAAVSAGTYTLPQSTDARTGNALNYPYGIANLAQTDGGQPFNPSGFKAVPIWIGVGGADTNASDVPAAWTPYLGTTRVDRAQRFAQVLQTLGADVSLRVFPNTGHTLTDEMRAAGCGALATDASEADTPPD